MPGIDIWDLYNALHDMDRSTLNPIQRGLLSVCDLRQEVASDGFNGYFSYWGGDSANEAANALPTLLGQAWADILREAMDLFGPIYPTDSVARSSWIDSHSLVNTLNELDERLYALEVETDADLRLNEYISRTPEASI